MGEIETSSQLRQHSTTLPAVNNIRSPESDCLELQKAARGEGQSNGCSQKQSDW